MTRRFDGRSIIVTGAASGIGRAAAFEFAAEGGQVLVADLNLSGAETVAKAIIEEGGSAVAAFVDVADPDSCEAMVATAMGAFGRLDVAVNNAGVPGSMTRKVHEYSLDEWEVMIRTNLSGVFHAMRAEVPAMMEGGRGGAIVNTASAAGLVAGPTMSSYVAAKHGVVGLTKASALDLIGDGIRVNAVCPGVVRTGMTEPAMTDPGLRALLAANPVRRIAEPDEIANLILYLASDEASFMVGAAVPIDGGVTAQ